MEGLTLMVLVIRWYLCPVVPHPSGDPRLPLQPDPWVAGTGGRKTWVLLSGDEFAVLRIDADQAAQDALLVGAPPQGFFRLPLAMLWSALPAATQTFIASRWPAAVPAAGDTLRMLLDQLMQLRAPLMSVAIAYLTGIESAPEE